MARRVMDGLFRLIAFILLLIAVWLLFSAIGDAAPDCEKEITATIGDHECDDNEWHFIITQIWGEKPDSIFVEWTDGYSETLPLAWKTRSTAHYTTTSHLDVNVISATAEIYVSWDGEFNLSHGPCIPTAVMLSCSIERRGYQDVVVKWNNASFGDVVRDGEIITGIVSYDGEFIDYPGSGEHIYWVENGIEWCGPLIVTVPRAVYFPIVKDDG